MISLTWRSTLAGLVIIAMCEVLAGNASAQCATCPVPTVAYQPVVAQPTVAYRPYTGWYPGKWVDQWRLRRAGVAAVAPAYTAAYAPSYTASYAPSYTASYAPSYTASYAPSYTASYAPSYTASYAPSYTAAYRPYVTSFAPLSAPAAAPCNTCTQTAYYPVVQTVARPVLMRPVVAAAPACNTCSFTPSCGCDACSTGCDSCSSGVSQAAYTEPGCSSCAGGTQTNVVPDNYDSNGYNSNGGGNVGQQTPQPTLSPVPAQDNSTPIDSRYDSRYESNRPLTGSDGRDDGARADDVVPAPVKEVDPGPAPVAAPVTSPPATESDSSSYYNAPRLLDPRDRTARSSSSRKPTVAVWNAVYRQSTTARPVTQTSSHRTSSVLQQRSQAQPRSQAEIDADGWSAVPRNR